MNWLIDNKEWMFSGLGLGIMSLIVKIIVNKKKKATFNIESGENCVNTQINKVEFGNRNVE